MTGRDYILSDGIAHRGEVVAAPQNTQALQHTELVVAHDAMARWIVVLLIHLERGQAQHIVRGSRVADHALGPAGVVPDLLADALGSGRIFDNVFPLPAGMLDQQRIALVIVPAIGISVPLPLLAGEQARLDPA